jgi:SPP1 gp7 family putative phage head morphogenesis protein
MATKRRPRKPQRIPSRAARYARSPQPPAGAELFYRLALRRIARGWAKAIRRRLLARARQITGERLDATPEDADALASSGLELLGGLTRTLNTVAERVEQHSKKEFQRIGIKIRDAEPRLTPKITAWRKQNVSLVTKLLKRESKKLEKLLTEGEGRTYKALAADIEERLAISSRRAELIARDQTLTLNAQINQERQQAAGITEFLWTTAGDERVRSSHEDLDGKRFRYDDPPIVDGAVAVPGEPIQCLPGNAQITFSGAVNRLYRRRYSGELTTLVAESGITFESTPNHPVLTATGWKPAQQVNVGDYVFEVRDQRVDAAKSQIENRVAEIANLFDSLACLGGSRWERGLTSQFHGDGSNEQVDIIDIDGILRPNLELSLSKQLLELTLSRPVVDMARLESRARALQFGLSALLGTAPSDMSGLGLRLANLERRVAESDRISLRSAAQLGTGAQQEIANALALDPIALSKSLDGSSLPVELETFVLREALSVVRLSVLPKSPDTISAERLGQIVRVTREATRDLADQGAILKHPLRVLKKFRREFSSHVFNLETVSGWYSASIAVLNCRCVAFPILPELDDQ